MAREKRKANINTLDAELNNFRASKRDNQFRVPVTYTLAFFIFGICKDCKQFYFSRDISIVDFYLVYTCPHCGARIAMELSTLKGFKTLFDVLIVCVLVLIALLAFCILL